MYIMVFILVIYNVFTCLHFNVFCSSNVSIDHGIFGFSIGASKIGLDELTESNGPVCDDVISGLGGHNSP
jgi:hypothetical protein